MRSPAYRLGLPVWAFPEWKDRYFSTQPSPLTNYARVFTAVEGNTSFYHIPPEDTVASWADALAGSDLKVSFKLPRTVTHERRASVSDLKLFIQRLEPLTDHLGPLLLQFPARIGARYLDSIDRLCRLLPEHYRPVIEVRHPEFFSQFGLLEPLLKKHNMGRVVMDTRAIFRGNRMHPEVLAALHDKPDLPVLNQVYSNRAFIRLMLHPDIVSNEPYVREWAATVAGYLQAGVDTTMMIHCPNNLHCPPLAEYFHKTLLSQPGMESIPNLPVWPIPQQTALFD